MYDTDQLFKFLELMEKHGEFNQFVYFRLLAFTGLRRSEALALKKSDININERSLSISRTLAEDEYKSTIVSNYTKTGNAEDEEVSFIWMIIHLKCLLNFANKHDLDVPITYMSRY